MELNPVSKYASIDFRTTQSPMKLDRTQGPMALPGREAKEMPIKRELSSEEKHAALKDAFQDFVGQTYFGQMIKSLRSAQDGAAYLNGGRAEEIFQGQFDQMLSEHLSEASAQSIADPMFQLFQLGRMSG